MKLGEIELTPAQDEALHNLNIGNVLVGGVGSGKTYTSIFWAYLQSSERRPTIYVITTAMARNLGSWQESFKATGIDNYVIDSWNNIHKYANIKDGVFIFDEQRVVGYGKWAKVFIKIAWNGNPWVLCSATPADVWEDYIALFIANKFYYNKKQFVNKHIVYDPYVKWPKVLKYLEEDVLEELRDKIVVPMIVERHTTRHRTYKYCDYDTKLYNSLIKNRFNFIEDRPIETPSEFTQLCRRVTGTSTDRQNGVLNIVKNTPRVIIFYNFTYELELLTSILTPLNRELWVYNGKQHQKIDPTVDEWIYLVQYNAGAEAWNCILTDTIIFYSLNHSYRKMEQCEGRIDRMNTPYTDLYYYYMTSNAKIDKDIQKAINTKKRFNEGNWGKKYLL